MVLISRLIRKLYFLFFDTLVLLIPYNIKPRPRSDCSFEQSDLGLCFLLLLVGSFSLAIILISKYICIFTYL